MSFYASTNRIKLTDQNGVIVFDTNNKMPVVMDVITGSLSLPNHTPYNGNNAFGSTNYDVGAAGNGPYDFIFGAISYTSTYYYNDQQVTRSVLKGDFSGSVITHFLNPNAASGTDYAPQGVRILSPIISGGRACIKEDFYVYGGAGPNGWLIAFDIQFKLYLGIYK